MSTFTDAREAVEQAIADMVWADAIEDYEPVAPSQYEAALEWLTWVEENVPHCNVHCIIPVPDGALLLEFWSEGFPYFEIEVYRKHIDVLYWVDKKLQIERLDGALPTEETDFSFFVPGW